MDSSVQEKQQYLRSEIIDKGYDPNSFAEYISAFTGGNNNIEEISQAQLEYYVSDFISLQLAKNEGSSIPKKKTNFFIDEEDKENKTNYYDKNKLSTASLKGYMGMKNANSLSTISLIEEPQTQENFLEGSYENLQKFNFNTIKEDKNKEDDNSDFVNEGNKFGNGINSQIKKDYNTAYVSETKNEDSQDDDNKDDSERNRGEDSNSGGDDTDKNQSSVMMNNASQFSNLNIENDDSYICCLKQEKNQFTDMSKMKVNITKYEYVKDGLFSFSYYIYTLYCPDLDIETKRRYSDFVWLREKLMNIYPKIFLSPLPGGKPFQKNSDTKLIKRKFFLQKFLNSLLKNKLIRSSEIFKDFITLPREQFINNKKKYEDIQKPKSLFNLVNMEGLLNIGINPDMENKAKSITEDIEKKKRLLDELNEGIKELIYEIGIMSEKIYKLSNLFSKLEQGCRETVPLENDRCTDNFSHLKEMMKTWSESYEKQRDFFRFDFRYFFKFMKNELVEFGKLAKEYEEVRDTFNEYKNTENTNPDKLAIKNYYGFYINRVIEEYTKLNRQHHKRIKNNFDISDKEKEILCTDYVNFMQIISAVI